MSTRVARLALVLLWGAALISPAYAQSCSDQIPPARIAICSTTQGACTGLSGTNCVADVRCQNSSQACLNAIPTDRFSIYKTFYCDNLDAANVSTDRSSVIRKICPNESVAPTTPAPTGTDSGTTMAIALAAAAFAAAIQAGRDPDPAASALHLRRSRMGFMYQGCSHNRSNELSRERERGGDMRYRGRLSKNRSMESEGQAIMEKSDRQQLELNETCMCVTGRVIQQFTEEEWAQLASRQRAERPWTSLDASRLRAVFAPCAAMSPSDKDLSWLYETRSR